MINNYGKIPWVYQASSRTSSRVKWSIQRLIQQDIQNYPVNPNGTHFGGENDLARAHLV